MALTNQRNAMLHRWEERWEHLQLSKIEVVTTNIPYYLQMLGESHNG